MFEHGRYGKDQDNFRFKDQKQNGDNVEPEIKLYPGITYRNFAAFISALFYGGRELGSQEFAEQQHRRNRQRADDQKK